MKNIGLFLDRDGVVNVDKNYLYKISDLEFMPYFFEMLSFFSLFTQIFIITNQSGIARGYFSELDFKKLDLHIKKELEKKGLKITKTYFCPHLNENCECRKPKPGMIKKALKEYNINAKKSILIGDKISDIEAGKAGGINILILLSENFAKNGKNTESGFTFHEFGKSKLNFLQTLLHKKLEGEENKEVFVCKNHKEILALFKGFSLD